MDRQRLIDQVKEEYASIASAESQRHFHRTTTGITPETYYEKLLQAVVIEIERGTFDRCRSGMEIVNRVAADKAVLADWDPR